jgi:hypothetical protein
MWLEVFLPANDISVAVGDSGLGKTPLAYQLGICIAAGKPFLGMPTTQSGVLYVDLENGANMLPALTENICKVVKLDSVPDEFRVISESCDFEAVANAIAHYEPGIVIADTLRALEPEAEEKNSGMGAFLKKSRAIAQEYGCAILLLHHIKKPREEALYQAALSDSKVMEWLNKASGARSLINQSNARIGIDSGDSTLTSSDLVMKWFVKLEGESENVYIERVLDEGGKALGYRRLQGINLLSNPDQRAAFERLPEQFTFKQAVQTYGRSDKPTNQWLRKCLAAGIVVQQVEWGPYEKVDPRVE